MHTLSYEQARTVITDGDIVFIHGSWRDPLQAIIMLFTASPFSHVCVAFWVETGIGRRLMCVEAQAKARRRILTMGYYEDSEMTVLAAPLPWQDVRASALSRVGKAHYGLAEAMYVGICEFVKRRTGIKLPMRPVSREYCSTFVADMYQLPVRTGSPQALYEQLLTITHSKEGISDSLLPS